MNAFRDPPPFAIEAQGHSLNFLPAGPDRLAALLDMIEGAQTSLKLAFYIFDMDTSGTLVRDALVAAARRGVGVSVIVDGFGAKADAAFFADLVAAGGSFCVFEPRWTVRALIRNHQKIVLADETRAMLGGFNVADDYFAMPENDGWTDLGFTISGPVVARIASYFGLLEGWVDERRARIRDIRKGVREWRAGVGPVQLLIGGPTRGLSSWARTMTLDLLDGERLALMMAYFSPGRRLRRLIRRIAAKGNTDLLLAGRSDNGATIGASRALYRNLLASGARIHEFLPCRLHTKLLVLDDATYLGSANLDMRSLYLNLEIVLRIEDKALAERMRGFIAHYLAASEPITPALHASRATWWNRLRWGLSWFLVSTVDYTVTRRLNLGLGSSYSKP